MRLLCALAVAAALMPAAAAERTRVLVRHAGIAIDTIVEGAGPAVVLQTDSTTVVPPGWQAVADGEGNLILTGGGG